jgi:hypothetical protein
VTKPGKLRNFVVVDAVAAAIQDELALVHLDGTRVVGGVTVDHVDAAVDQPVGERYLVLRPRLPAGGYQPVGHRSAT